MSLTVSETGKKEFPILEEGSYVAICNMLVDLGMQFNETYGNSSRKVLIGWELPEELIEINGEKVPRTINQRYTASLNEKSVLRRDLAAWRGRDFTPAELAEFNLRNIVGAPCLLQIIHRDYNGKKYANVVSVMSLPKGMAKPQMSEPPVVYDIDEDDPAKVNELAPWIKEIIVKSDSYQQRITQGDGVAAPEFTELEDDGELPF
jgi:hypothetical protein